MNPLIKLVPSPKYISKLKFQIYNLTFHLIEYKYISSPLTCRGTVIRVTHMYE